MTEEEIASMSDEEFREFENADAVRIDAEIEAEEVSAQEESEEVDADSNDDTEETQSDSDEENQDDNTDNTENTEAKVESGSEDETNEDTQETSEESEDAKTGTAQDVEDDTDTFKSQYETLMAPIKANGSEVTIKSPEDARRLIQMGLNYEEKMIGIKPVRLAGKALENAGIIKDGVVDEVALNRMIDFNSGNIDVVKQRLKELKIDPLDLDLDESNYTAQNHMVDEKSLVLDDVQRELDVRGSTNVVIDAISAMDEGSRNYFSDNPKSLLGLEQDIASGAFAELNETVQYEKRMGRLGSKTDMEAYIELAQMRANQATQTLEPQLNTTQTTKTVNKEKRAKAGGSKPTGGKQKAVMNPFEMSDDEFEKEFGGQTALR